MRNRNVAISASALALVVALAAVPAGCAKTDVAVPGLPTLDPAQLDKDVRAGAIKALGVLEAAGKLVARASRYEESLVSAGIVPPQAHEAYRKGVEALRDRALQAIDAIEKGVVQQWADLQKVVNPVLEDVNKLATIARTFAAGVSRDNLLEFIAALSEVIAGALPKDPQPASGS